MGIGLNIRRRREELKLSQDELASRLDTTRQSIYNWETEYTSPDAATIEKIAKELNCSISYLFEEKEDLTNQSYTRTEDGDFVGGYNETSFDKASKVFKKHWRKIYIWFFIAGFSLLLIGGFAKLTTSMMLGFVDNKDSNGAITDDYLDKYFKDEFGAGFNSGFSSGQDKMDQITATAKTIFSTISTIMFVVGVILVTIGVVLLVNDIIVQKRNKLS